MRTEYLQHIYSRDLEKVMNELKAYHNEDCIWQIENSIRNSAGVLTRHIIGNLNANIGAVFGKTGYIRDRDAEFADAPVTREALLEGLEDTQKVVVESLRHLKQIQLQEAFPNPVSTGEHYTTEFMLMHLTTHLAYHLGQINYHRRLLDK